MKVRVRFAKRGKVRFLSHRDLARVWERALRRSGIRAAYSEGFSPRPKLSFGLALSTGYESLGEYLDIDLADDLEPEELVALVNPSLPVGMEAQVAIRIPPGTDSLQQAVLSSSWQIELTGVDPAQIAGAVTAALAVDSLPITVERKGSETELDARPAILALSFSFAPALAPLATASAKCLPATWRSQSPPALVTARPTLFAELATHPRSLRPAELLRALDPTWTASSVNVSVLRTNQWTSVDGARCEPIPFGDLGARGATSTPHAEARV